MLAPDTHPGNRSAGCCRAGAELCGKRPGSRKGASVDSVPRRFGRASHRWALNSGFEDCKWEPRCERPEFRCGPFGGRSEHPPKPRAKLPSSSDPLEGRKSSGRDFQSNPGPLAIFSYSSSKPWPRPPGDQGSQGQSAAPGSAEVITEPPSQ